MKRLLILLILLFALPAYAQQCTEETPCSELARLSPAMMGSVPVVAGCTTANDVDLYATSAIMNDIWGNSDDANASESNVDFRHATKFATTANATVTGYRVQGLVDDDTGTITYTCHIRLDEAGTPAGGSVEGTDYVTGSMATLSVANSWSTSAEERTVDLATPISLSTGTYWLSCGTTVATGDYPIIKIDTAGMTGSTSISTNATSTHTYGVPTENRVYRMKIFGCP